MKRDTGTLPGVPRSPAATPWSTLVRSSSVPSAAHDGAVCLNTADGMLYRYFEAYSAWLSDQLFSVDYGRAAAVTTGEQLRLAHGTVQPANVRGYKPFSDGLGDIKIIGIEGRTAGVFTGSLEIYSGTTATGVLLEFAGTEDEATFSLNHDFDNSQAMGLVINISSGTPSNPTGRVWYRKRWT